MEYICVLSFWHLNGTTHILVSCYIHCIIIIIVICKSTRPTHVIVHTENSKLKHTATAHTTFQYITTLLSTIVDKYAGWSICFCFFVFFPYRQTVDNGCRHSHHCYTVSTLANCSSHVLSTHTRMYV